MIPESSSTNFYHPTTYQPFTKYDPHGRHPTPAVLQRNKRFEFCQSIMTDIDTSGSEITARSVARNTELFLSLVRGDRVRPMCAVWD